jgi:hypothetical protein
MATQDGTSYYPAESFNLRLLGHSDLNGQGATMQLIARGDHLYVGHFRGPVGFSVVDVSDPRTPRVVKQIPAQPGTRCLKLQVAHNLLLVSQEQVGTASARTGMLVYELSNPADPRPVGRFETKGGGPHWLWFADGRHVYMSARLEGYTDRIALIVDVTDPSTPREVGRWWIPGMWTAGGEKPWWDPVLNFNIHACFPHGDRLYIAMFDNGLGILDISDKKNPYLVSQLQWLNGRSAHTVLPLPDRDLLVVTEETGEMDCMEYPRYIRVIDIKDEQNPRILSRFPTPRGSFRRRGMRFGCHDVHVNYPGSTVDDRLIYATFYNAGLRVVDISDPAAPKEVAYYVPEAPPTQKAIQTNQVYVDAKGLIYLSDIEGAGLHILEWSR